MRRKLGILAIALLIAAFCSPIHSYASNWENHTGYRVHASKTLSDGTVVQVTEIFLSKGHDSSSGNISLHRIVLLDGGKNYGRWVVETRSKSSSDFSNVKATNWLTCLTTGESVVISTSLTGKLGQGKFTCTMGSAKATFSDEDVSSSAGVIYNWIIKHASTSYATGLNFLRRLVSAPQALGLSIQAFDWIYGTDVRAQVDSSLGGFKLQQINCEFDASFGYPCTKGEKASPKNKMHSFKMQ